MGKGRWGSSGEHRLRPRANHERLLVAADEERVAVDSVHAATAEFVATEKPKNIMLNRLPQFKSVRGDGRTQRRVALTTAEILRAQKARGCCCAGP